MANNRYCIDLAKRGTAACKECKQKIGKGIPRIGKIISNPFSDSAGDMKLWFHVRCAFVKLTRAKAATKKIESTDDIEGYEDMDDEYKAEVIKCIDEFTLGAVTKKDKKETKKNESRSSKKASSTPVSLPSSSEKAPSTSVSLPSSSETQSDSEKDDLFREFRRLIARISDENSYLEKTEIMRDFFNKGTDGKKFKGDLLLWIKMLLPSVNKKIYSLRDKQLINLFSQIFDEDKEKMLEELEEAETVAEVIQEYFEQSERLPPIKKSTLTLQEVDRFLVQLTQTTKEEGRKKLFEAIAKRCTGNDLKVIILLIKHDLRMGVSGPKHVLDAIHPDANAAFQASRNLSAVIEKILKLKEGKIEKELQVDVKLMTPVLPMLAAPCKKIEQAFSKCPGGMLAEVKYDGERVQIHKNGNQFMYFSRSLKPVQTHKILHLKDYIPKAFPCGDSLILDSEILLVNRDGKPLPFGTLGAHKQKNFTDANVCLFVFDCLQFNEGSLLNKPLHERRQILEKNMQPIKNRILLSEMTVIKDLTHLKKLVHSVCKQGLEGLVVKGRNSTYEPGKRHWLKVKKDHLKEDDMADTADLVVLGAEYGTGKFAGKKSTFLMGCLDEETGKYCTVTRVHGGFSEVELESLQDKLKMKKIGKDPSKVPYWLNINKSLIPDFVAEDPKKSEVWEITGAEFSKADIHTADGISIRFPRVTKRRLDKDPKDAFTLNYLKELYEESKKFSTLIGLRTSPPPSPRKRSGSPNAERDSKRKRSSSPKKILPDVFVGMKLYLPPQARIDVNILKKYFIAFGGIFVDGHELDEATHAIATDSELDEKYPDHVHLVTGEWLLECISRKSLVRTCFHKTV